MKPQLLKTLLLSLVIFIVQNTRAQLPGLIPYRKGKMWGYCDSNKVVKIEPKYNGVFWFDVNGYAIVYEGYYSAKKLIDTAGREILSGNFSSAGHTPNLYFLRSDNDDSVIMFDAVRGNKYVRRQISSYSRNNNYNNLFPLKGWAVRNGDTVFLYQENGQTGCAIDARIKYVFGAYNAETALYNKKDNSTEGVFLQHTDTGEYWLCTDTADNMFVRYKTGKIKYVSGTIKPVNLMLKQYVFFDDRQYYVFSPKGELKIITKNIIFNRGDCFIELRGSTISSDSGINVISREGEMLFNKITYDSLSKIIFNNYEPLIVEADSQTYSFYNKANKLVHSVANIALYTQLGALHVFVNNNNVAEVFTNNFKPVVKFKVESHSNIEIENTLFGTSNNWLWHCDSGVLMLFSQQGKLFEIKCGDACANIKHVGLLNDKFFYIYSENGSKNSVTVLDTGGKQYYAISDKKWVFRAPTGANMISYTDKDMKQYNTILVTATDVSLLQLRNKYCPALGLPLLNNPEFSDIVNICEPEPDFYVFKDCLAQVPDDKRNCFFVDKYGTVYYHE